MHQKTAVVDFDNTLAGYDRWRGEKVLGPPLPYAKDAIAELLEWGWRVVIFTTRGNVALIDEWLRGHGFPVDRIQINSTEHNPPGTSHKPIGEVYFDDRDAHIVGTQPYNWHRAMKRVRRLYQPRLSTEIDDASLWANWWVKWFVAPFKRFQFQRTLDILLSE